MPKRKRKKATKAAKAVDPLTRLRTALSKRTKVELIDVVAELAKEDRRVFRQLASQFDLGLPPNELVAATRCAIADATDFDERDINHNFDYDYEAYDEVKRNLERLIELGHLRKAMELSLELMDQGSHQIEMSDEGLMITEIEECLNVVIGALPKSDLPANQSIPWCREMVQTDRIRCVCDQQLKTLRYELEASRSK